MAFFICLVLILVINVTVGCLVMADCGVQSGSSFSLFVYVLYVNYDAF